MEVVSPDIRGFETIFSNQHHLEGVAHLAHQMGGEMHEHGYWGSARDRLPAAQTSALKGQGQLTVTPLTSGRHIVQGRDNLCLIRSGQDWSDTLAEERALYVQEVEPISGMRLSLSLLSHNISSISIATPIPAC